MAFQRMINGFSRAAGIRRDGDAPRPVQRPPGAACFPLAAALRRSFAAACLLAITPVAQASTALNTPIINTATASFSIDGTQLSTSDSATTLVDGRTPARIEFLEYVPGNSGGSVEQVNQAYCGGQEQADPQFIAPPAQNIPLPGQVRLQPAAAYSFGDPIFVRVVDPDQNGNAEALDTIEITLTTPAGDSETLTLTETGDSTGVFIGYLQSTGSATSAASCSLTIAAKNSINASYTDPLDDIQTVVDAALVDPFGIVFDSASGDPVDGAQVTLISNETGLPATVYCDDGVTVLPQPVTSGSPTVCDASMSSGGYRLPRAAQGSYRLSVVAPTGYTFPSVDSTPAGSYTVVGAPGSGASYGGNFQLVGPPLRIDLPLDPPSTELRITKVANKTVAAIGDFVPYTLTVTNIGQTAAVNAKISDRLPAGFRYQSGSARLNAAKAADPAISSDGRVLSFNVGDIAPGASVTLKYVTAIAAGASKGLAENTASALSPHASNTARASVFVREDLFRNQAILMGRVIVGSCDDKADNDAKGLENARILLQDGRYVQTDQDGRWHMDNVRPGTHVVQLDLHSLPEGYEAVACEKNTRFAGRSYSQFVNVRGGSLWRADFHVRKKAPESICLEQKLSYENGSLTLAQSYPVSTLNGSVTLVLPEGARVAKTRLNGEAFAAEIDGNILVARLPSRFARVTDTLHVELAGGVGEPKSMSRVQVEGLPAQSLPAMSASAGKPAAQCAPLNMLETVSHETPMAAPAQKHAQLVEKLPYDEKWLASAQPGTEWLHPREDFFPALPSIKIAVKHAPGERLEMLLNGQPVSPLSYDGALQNADRSVSLSTWRGVDIKDGANQLSMRVLDANGTLLKEETRTIRYIVAPARVTLDEKQSRLLADGKTRPVIAVRFSDANGYPVRNGVNGEFQVNAPYQSWDREEGIARAPLSGRIGGNPRYEITADGIALIELKPTTQSGEAVLTFQFADGKPQTVRAWLKPGTRDWVLVGFAEGTAGFERLSGNKTALREADADDKLYDGNRLAFYAKGMIKGEYLLTMAYDTAKSRNDGGSPQRNLKQAIDPNQYYTLYGDATSSQYDAASASKLYLKLERNQFYAMFGDYDTGLTVTEFGNYSRTLNGIKSEFKGDALSYNAFAAMTSQAYVKDEIQGDGTSGLYRLSRGDIIINSDKVRIETRDRFHSEVVLRTLVLSRFLDYDIDYTAGTLFLRSPLAGRDEFLNPNYIVAEYESESDGDKKLTYGGRAALKATKNLEIGLTHIHVGNVGASGNLTAADATLNLSEKTVVKAELAGSDSNQSGVKADGIAWKLEVIHEDENFSAKAYAREQEGGFGLGQQAAGETGTRKFGADFRLKLSDTLQLQGQAYRQDMLGTGAQRQVAESLMQWRKDALTTQAGVRMVHDQNALGETHDSRQLVLGAGYEMLEKKLVLRATAEMGLFGAGNDDSVDFPDRYVLGADYKLTEQTTLFAEQEFARGSSLAADTTRVGLRTKPWSGGEVAASVGSDLTNDSGRLFANLGLVQKWQINESWMVDFGVDRVSTLKSDGVLPINPSVPLASGTLNADYTALFAGFNFSDTIWSANSRIEWRSGDMEDRLNLLAGVQRKLANGHSVAAGLSFISSENAAGAVASKLDTRLSWAYRPVDGQWIVLERFDFIDESTEDASGKISARKLVNNLNANWMPNRRTQIALQYGAKYAFETIDGTGYNGFTDLVGAEIRRDLGEDWDIGLHGSVLHSWEGGQFDYGLGASIGYKLFDNAWIAVGYNVLGFQDDDFAGAEYRAKGFYAAMRMKFDQDTLGLNKPDSVFTMKP